MFYKVFGSLIVITFFYNSKKQKIKNLQTTEYVDIWDDIYKLDDIKDF